MVNIGSTLRKRRNSRNCLADLEEVLAAAAALELTAAHIVAAAAAAATSPAMHTPIATGRLVDLAVNVN